MSLEEDVLRIKGKLEKITKGESTHLDPMDLLNCLADMRMDLATLQKTYVGRTVNDLRKSTNCSKDVAERCERLIKQWKKLVKPKPANATTVVASQRKAAATAHSVVSLPPLVLKKLKILNSVGLAAIFKQTSVLQNRVLNTRMEDILGLPWQEIGDLDLNVVDKQHIGVVVRECPNLRTVYGHGLQFGVDADELHCLSKVPGLSTVKLYDCKFSLDSSNVLKCAFSDNFTTRTTLQELVLIDVSVTGRYASHWCFPLSCLPVSLKRLQLSGLRASETMAAKYDEVNLRDLEKLQNLECFILHATPSKKAGRQDVLCAQPVPSVFVREVATAIYTLKNLRELCLGVDVFSPEVYTDPWSITLWPKSHRREKDDSKLARLIAGLPRLEVLFCNAFSNSVRVHVMKSLLARPSHSVLRILVLRISADEFECLDSDEEFAPQPTSITPLNRPNASSSGSLPLLHVFLGYGTSADVKLPNWPANIDVHQVDEPMAQFLEREDIAPIFKDVWIAEKIKEAAKLDYVFWPRSIA